MRVFLSYASEQTSLAEQVGQALTNAGHRVFRAHEDLRPGDDYHSRIQGEILRSQVFVFLITDASIAEGCYALSELRFATERRGRNALPLLPVMVEPIAFDRLPSALSERTVLEVCGDVPAEVVATLHVLRLRRRRAKLRYAALGASVLLAAGLTGVLLLHGPVSAPEVPATEPVRLKSWQTNQGWMLTFDVSERGVREILYQLDGEGQFRSTGFQENRHPDTSLPLPRFRITLPVNSSGRVLAVKYIDASGRARGPYRLHFDPGQATLDQAVRTLDLTNWVSFREYPEGRLLAQFTPLIAQKNALRAILYSVDDDTLDRSLRFTHEPGRSRIRDDDETYVEIPMSSKYVAVKVIYVDGNESETRRVVIAEAGIDRD